MSVFAGKCWKIFISKIFYLLLFVTSSKENVKMASQYLKYDYIVYNRRLKKNAKVYFRKNIIKKIQFQLQFQR